MNPSVTPPDIPVEEYRPPLLGAVPEALGVRARDPRGWRWTMPSAVSVPSAGQAPTVALPEAEDPVERLYRQIDALWEQYHELSLQESRLEVGEVEEPSLLDIPLPPALPPMPAPAQIDPNLSMLASLAAMAHPMGGGLYMGLPLAEREQRTRSDYERWAMLRESIARQYRDFVTGLQALNEMQLEVWKLRRTKAEDLLRVKVQQVSRAKQQILDRISQLEATASRLREQMLYREILGQAAMMRAEALQQRTEAEVPLLEARAEQARAAAGLSDARAWQIHQLTPPQVTLLRIRAQEVQKNIERMSAQIQEIAARVNTRLDARLQRGQGRPYLEASDVDVRSLTKSFDDLVKERSRAVQLRFGQGYVLGDDADRAEIESIQAWYDDQLNRIAYTLYVSTGGRINRFALLNNAQSRDWEQRARQAVATIERGGMKVPVLMFRPKGAEQQPEAPTGMPPLPGVGLLDMGAQPSQQKAPQQKAPQQKAPQRTAAPKTPSGSGERQGATVTREVKTETVRPGWWQRTWDSVRNWFSGSKEKPAPTGRWKRPTGSSPAAKPSAAAPTPGQAKRSSAPEVKRLKIEVTDAELARAQKKQQRSPIKLLEVE